MEKAQIVTAAPAAPAYISWICHMAPVLDEVNKPGAAAGPRDDRFRKFQLHSLDSSSWQLTRSIRVMGVSLSCSTSTAQRSA